MIVLPPNCCYVGSVIENREKLVRLIMGGCVSTIKEPDSTTSSVGVSVLASSQKKGESTLTQAASAAARPVTNQEAVPGGQGQSASQEYTVNTLKRKIDELCLDEGNVAGTPGKKLKGSSDNSKNKLGSVKPDVLWGCVSEDNLRNIFSFCLPGDLVSFSKVHKLFNQQSNNMLNDKKDIISKKIDIVKRIYGLYKQILGGRERRYESLYN